MRGAPTERAHQSAGLFPGSIGDNHGQREQTASAARLWIRCLAQGRASFSRARIRTAPLRWRCAHDTSRWGCHRCARLSHAEALPLRTGEEYAAGAIAAQHVLQPWLVRSGSVHEHLARVAAHAERSARELGRGSCAEEFIRVGHQHPVKPGAGAAPECRGRLVRRRGGLQLADASEATRRGRPIHRCVTGRCLGRRAGSAAHGLQCRAETAPVRHPAVPAPVTALGHGSAHADGGSRHPEQRVHFGRGCLLSRLAGDVVLRGSSSHLTRRDRPSQRRTLVKDRVQRRPPASSRAQSRWRRRLPDRRSAHRRRLRRRRLHRRPASNRQPA
eukprot:scaffold11722_cov100-Isochrysis_galbana.AAC.3